MGILNCEEAHGREEQARVLAETPGMTVETARRILAAAPQSAQARSDTALDRLMQGAPAPLAAGNPWHLIPIKNYLIHLKLYRYKRQLWRQKKSLTITSRWVTVIRLIQQLRPGGLSAKTPAMTPLMLDGTTRKLVVWDGTTDGAAVGILAVAADQTSTTLTFYKSGSFRYEDVLWPEAASDETKKRTAFAGTAISIV